MDTWTLLGNILLLLATAVAAGVLLRWLGQDVVVGYLLAGLLLGPTGLAIIGEAGQLRGLSELGVALLLFSIGLEFSFSRLRQIGRIATLGGAMQISLTALLAAPVLLGLGLEMQEAAVLGFAIALSSTAVVIRSLMARAEIDSAHGRVAVGILLFQDVAVVPLLVVIEALAEGTGGGEALGRFGVRMLAAAGLGVLVWVVMKRAVPGLFIRAALSGSRDVPVIVAVCAALGAAAGAHALGLSPALGAFLAGILLAESPFATQIRADVTPLTAVFIAIFFGSIGTVVTLPGGADLLLVAAGAAGVLVLKTLAAASVVWVFRRSLRTALAAGLVLSQVGEFTFLVAGAAAGRGLLSARNFEFLVAISVLTLIATPYAVSLAPRLSDALARRTTPDLRRTGVASQQAQRKVIVIGFGPSARQVVQMLRENSVAYSILEFNPHTVAAFASTMPIELGDATQPEILEHAGVKRAQAVVVTLPDPFTSRTVIAQVARLAPDVPVIARSRYHRHAATLSASGAVAVVDEEQVVGMEMARSVLESLRGSDSG